MAWSPSRAADVVAVSSARGGPASPCGQGTVARRGASPYRCDARAERRAAVSHAGTFADARVYTMREAELARLMPAKQSPEAANKQVLCPMPGLLRELLVREPGQVVKVGESLAVVEAMKMENVLKAERDGTVGAASWSNPATASASRRSSSTMRERRGTAVLLPPAGEGGPRVSEGRMRGCATVGSRLIRRHCVPTPSPASGRRGALP